MVTARPEQQCSDESDGKAMDATSTWDDASIRPIMRTRAHEEVARQLQELMHQGVLRSGDRLPPERELATRFQVSRATIRQALTVLHATGLIESRIGDGTFARSGAPGPSVTNLAGVLRDTPATLTDQLELRRMIEPQVAGLAAERATDAELEQLQGHITLQEARVDNGFPFIEEDSAFHLGIARATKNTLLVKMVEGIHELLRESRERSQQTLGGTNASLAGHRRLYEALLKRDSEAAYDAMLAHILTVERLSLQSLAQRNSN